MLSNNTPPLSRIFICVARSNNPVPIYLLPWSTAPGANASAAMPQPRPGNSCANMTLSDTTSLITVRATTPGENPAFTDPCFCASCSYILGFACPGTDVRSTPCMLRLSADIDNPSGPAIARIEDGAPVTGSLDVGTVAYYSFSYAVWGRALRNGE